MRRRPFLIDIAFDIWMIYMKFGRQKNIKYLSIETYEIVIIIILDICIIGIMNDTKGLY